MSKDMFIEEARGLAAQCWCDPETSTIEMNPALCEAVAKRISAWMDTAAMFARNEDFYRRLLDECAESLGPDAFTADDGTKYDDPVRLKVPSLVRDLAERNK